MTDDRPPQNQDAPLESWKAIAAYLNRDVRTVMRWEKSERLPVHRHQHLARSSVYAYRAELDRWRAGRRIEPLERPRAGTSAGLRIALVAATLTIIVASAGGGRWVGAPYGLRDRVMAWPGNAALADDEALSRDGRYVTYVDHDTGNLAIRDLGTGRSRLLTTLARQGGIYHSAVSNDDQFVAFAASDDQKDETRDGLFVLPLTTSVATPRRLLSNASIDSIEWSAHGRRLLIVVERGQGADLEIVSVTDGAVRLLKTIDPPGPGNHVAWSPDDEGVAYDVQAQPGQRQRDVYWVSTGGGPAAPLFAEPSNDSVVGWSPDGHWLVMRSDREGSRGVGLWALPVAHGRTSGAPTLLVPHFTGNPVTLTANGALFYEYGPTHTDDLLVASIDPRTGARTHDATFAAHDREAINTRPRWSADGHAFAYVTSRTTGPVLSIQDLSTGVVKEVPLNLSYLWTFDWSPDGATMVCRARDLEGLGGLFLIDLATGHVHRFNGLGLYFPQFTADGRAIGYFDLRRDDANGPNWRSYVEWTVATGATRVVENLKDFIPGRIPLGRSPDGHTLLATDSSSNATTLLAYDIRTHQSRALLHVELADAVNPEDGLEWLPDSSAVVVNVRAGVDNRRELWWIPIETTGAPRVLDVGVANVIDNAIAVRRVGEHVQIAFVAGDPLPSRTTELHYEFRLLQNFLPPGDVRR